MPIRINKYLQEQGVASRREADKLIEQGLVRVNGVRAVLGQQVNEGDVVEVGQIKKEYKYLLYYKPRGLATEDINFEGVYPVGRLDKQSEGLMILTNDGRVTAKVLEANSKMEKEYIVKVSEKLRSGVKAIFAKGMKTESLGKLLPAKAEIMDEHTLRVILHEGKKHQIRVMLNDLNYTVTSLKRVRIGTFRLTGLQPGNTRPLSKKEIADLLSN